jgi:hypothetical protein
MIMECVIKLTQCLVVLTSIGSMSSRWLTIHCFPRPAALEIEEKKVFRAMLVLDSRAKK